MALEPICSRLERLEHLALVLQQPEVAGQLGRRLRDAAQRVEHLRVELARVGLAGDGERLAEARACAVTRRSSSRTLAWSPSKSSRKVACVPVVPLQPRKRQRLEPVAELLEVEHEVLHPERRALADGGELGRLEVGVAEAGHARAVRAANASSAASTAMSRPRSRREPVAHEDQVGVVGDERAGGAEVDERPRRRRLVAEGVDVRHHVVPEPALVRAAAARSTSSRWARIWASASSGIGEAELALGLGEREPEPAPEPDPVRLAPELCIAGEA